jgi:TfoX/Sxy family transcriptional regulator of competence genes
MTKEANPDEDLVSRVRAALAAVPDVVEKKMFGSIGFMVRGHLCVSARPGRIMCRIDPARHGAAIRRKGCQTVVMKGRPCQGYVYVDAQALIGAQALSDWLNQALEYNRILAGAAR